MAASEFSVRYNLFVGAVTLEAIRITSLEAKVISEPHRARHVRLALAYPNPPAPSRGRGQEIAFLWQVSTSISAGRGSEELQVASVVVNMKAEYRWRKHLAVDDDVLDVFAKRNVPVNVWPWLRRLVSETCVDMGLQAPLLPLWRSPNG